MDVVMVAVSDSTSSRAALRWAAARAAALGAELRVVTAVDRPVPPGSPMVPSVCHADVHDLVTAGLAHQRRMIEGMLGDDLGNDLGVGLGVGLGAVKVAQRVDVGRPFGVIRDAACGADLVVLGATRRRSVRSLARRCRRRLSCAVVVIEGGRPC